MKTPTLNATAVPDATLRFMRLIWAIDHELERVSKRMEARVGLTVPQRMCLLLIAAQPGILASHLADILHLHRGTLSGIVRRLESSGLIRRVADDHDARRQALTLTSRGAAILRQRTGTFEDAVRQVLARSTTHELAAAERILAGLRTALQEVD